MTKQELIEKVAATRGLPAGADEEGGGARSSTRCSPSSATTSSRAKVTRRATPRFTYPGFGTFTKKRKNGRTGRNPQTGAPIVIPPSITVSFQPGQELKAFLNRAPLKSQGLMPSCSSIRRPSSPICTFTSVAPWRRTSCGPSRTTPASSCRSSRTGTSASWSTPIRRRCRRSATTSTSCTSWTEKIQSSPAAIERSIYEVIGKEYRSSRVSTIELRFNPMKRNVGGERDLDYIIAAALRGMDRACLDYGVKAGLIFCLAREFEYDLNEILVQEGREVARPRRHRHRPRRARAAHARARRRRRSLSRPVRARARRGPGDDGAHRRDHAHRAPRACWR